MQEQIKEFDIFKINDEEIRSCWVSQSNNDSIYVEIDLESKMNVKAIQINFQDFNSDIFGRPDDLRQQFVIQSSLDGKNWNTIADYSENKKDMPHSYIELKDAVDVKYIRYNHVYCTNNYLSISEFGVFGNGYGDVPKRPSNLKITRLADRRNAELVWEKDKSAIGYVIYWGIVKDKLNLSALMYDNPNYELRALYNNKSYYMQVESFNESGISEKSSIIFVE